MLLKQAVLAIASIPSGPILSDGEIILKDIDLKTVMARVKRETEWNDAQVSEGEKWYRRFLLLIFLGVNVVVPNKVIDEVWHAHVLDTKKYASDCQTIFGRFIHHNPNFGGDGNELRLRESYVKTNEAFRLHFGEDQTMMKSHEISAPEKCNNGSDDPSCYNSDGDRSRYTF